MLHNTTINNYNDGKGILEEPLLYPKLKAAWEAIESVSRRRDIIADLGIDRTQLWRLLNKRRGEEPMRRAYQIILEKELGVSESEEE